MTEYPTFEYISTLLLFNTESTLQFPISAPRKDLLEDVILLLLWSMRVFLNHTQHGESLKQGCKHLSKPNPKNQLSHTEA